MYYGAELMTGQNSELLNKDDKYVLAQRPASTPFQRERGGAGEDGSLSGRGSRWLVDWGGHAVCGETRLKVGTE